MKLSPSSGFPRKQPGDSRAHAKGILLFHATLALLANCAVQRAGLEDAEGPPGPTPSDVDTTARNRDYESQISSAWPFPVEVLALKVVDYPPDFVSEIRDQFLGPLAESPYVGRISKIEIWTGSSDWAQWTCVVHPRGKIPAIRIEGDNAFREGQNSKSPYATALARVLREFARMD